MAFNKSTVEVTEPMYYQARLLVDQYNLLILIHYIDGNILRNNHKLRWG